MPEVREITFSAEYARTVGQEVLYVTERAVFRLGRQGVELAELAPGVDLRRDVLDRMQFSPTLSANRGEMPARHFIP